MTQKKFWLSAKVSSDDPSAIKAILEALTHNRGTLKLEDDGFNIEAELRGESAKQLNRSLLTELRRAERKTRLRAEWTSGNIVEKFFDYVPKGTYKKSK